MSKISIWIPKDSFTTFLAAVASRIPGMQRALWRQSTGISADPDGL